MIDFSPGINRLLYEEPWPTVLALAVVWALMRIVSRRVSDEALGQRLRRASWPVLGIAAMAFGIAHFVVTPKEQVEQTFKELIAAIESEDHAAFDRLCTKDATAHYMRIEMNRSEIDAALSGLVFKDITVVYGPAVLLRKSPEEATTVSDLRSDIEGNWERVDMSALNLSNWTITWVRGRDGQWLADRFDYSAEGSSILQP